MNPGKNDAKANSKKVVRHLYLITVFFLVLTGFGQMPIFKRYYIADIPGMGWLAKFYITHYMHYLFAILFIAITAFAITEYLLTKRKSIKIALSGYIRGASVLGLVITGAFLVIRNLASSSFSPGFIIFLDLSHFIFVMILLMAGLYCVVFKKRRP